MTFLDGLVPVSAAYTIVVALLGVASTFITNQIKYASGASGVSALYLTVGVSVGLGAVATLLTGEFKTTAEGIIPSAGLIFSLATIIYKTINPVTTIPPTIPPPPIPVTS